MSLSAWDRVSGFCKITCSSSMIQNLTIIAGVRTRFAFSFLKDRIE